MTNSSSYDPRSQVGLGKAVTMGTRACLELASGESTVDRSGGIEEVQDDVCVPDRGESVSAHAFVEDVVRGEESGGVMQNHLHGPSCNDAYDASARGLRFRADDAEVFADEPIEEGGFAHVRFADHGHEACARYRGDGRGHAGS